MLYSLSPSTKRKYSNLKQLVGRQIVNRNKKNSTAGVTSGRWTTATEGDFKKGGTSIGQSDLEGQHACWESNGVVRARRLAKIGRERCSHRRVVSAFLRTWKQLCRHAQNAGREGEVGEMSSCQKGALRDGRNWESLKYSTATGYIFALISST